jgi:RNA polymerase subunit RPABC4/transcription elongation factor Spt4
MDLERILDTIQPFLVMFVALLGAFLTAVWVSAVIWAFRDIRARSRDIFAQILATLMVFLFFPLFPLPGLLLYLMLRPRETLAEIYERTLEEEALLQGIEERLACPSCNRRIEEDFLVCPTCHTRLKKGCVACDRRLHLRWTICPYCGADQTAAKTTPSLQPLPVTTVVEPREEIPLLQTSAPSSLPQPEGDAEGGFEQAGESQAAAEDEMEAEATAEDDVEAEATAESEARVESEEEGEPVAEVETKAEPMAEGEAEADPEPETETVALEPD